MEHEWWCPENDDCACDPDGGVNADLPVDHPFRSLNGAHRCVAIVGPLNSGEACGLPPEDHQPSTVTGSSASGGAA